MTKDEEKIRRTLRELTQKVSILTDDLDKHKAVINELKTAIERIELSQRLRKEIEKYATAAEAPRKETATKQLSADEMKAATIQACSSQRVEEKSKELSWEYTDHRDDVAALYYYNLADAMKAGGINIDRCYQSGSDSYCLHGYVEDENTLFIVEVETQIDCKIVEQIYKGIVSSFTGRFPPYHYDETLTIYGGIGGLSATKEGIKLAEKTGLYLLTQGNDGKPILHKPGKRFRPFDFNPLLAENSAGR